jgi:cytochrome P450
VLADPYGFVSERCRRCGSDVVKARLLQRTLLVTGPDAAELFYDPERFRREGAAPQAVKATLFGKGGVQGLDGAAHRARKALFMAQLTPPRVAELAARSREQWRAAAARWPPAQAVDLYREAQRVLARSVCEWAGVPVPASQAGEGGPAFPAGRAGLRVGHAGPCGRRAPASGAATRRPVAAQPGRATSCRRLDGRPTAEVHRLPR